MLEGLRKELVARIRYLALHDDEIAGIMSEVLGGCLGVPMESDVLTEMYCNAESAIIYEIVK